MKLFVIGVLVVLAFVGTLVQMDKGKYGAAVWIILGSIAIGILTNYASDWLDDGIIIIDPTETVENQHSVQSGQGTQVNNSQNGSTGSSDIGVQKRPVSVPLTELDVTKQGEYFYVGMNSYNQIYSKLYKNLDELCKDVNGNYYASESVHYISYFRLNEEGGKYRSITYFLNQDYDTLTGTIYRPYLSLHCNFDWTKNGIVEIYGDGVLLAEYIVSQDTYSTTQININVSGVRELRISMSGGWKDGDWDEDYYMPKVCMADLMVTDNP